MQIRQTAKPSKCEPIKIRGDIIQESILAQFHTQNIERLKFTSQNINRILCDDNQEQNMNGTINSCEIQGRTKHLHKNETA